MTIIGETQHEVLSHWAARRRLERLTPSPLRMGSSSTARLKYQQGQNPWDSMGLVDDGYTS